MELIFISMLKIDEKDLLILDILKKNAKLQTSRISKITKIPITTVHNRIKKLKKLGVIKKYTIDIDFEKIGKPILAYLLVTALSYSEFKEKPLTQNEVAEIIKKSLPIEEINVITGVYDFMIKVRTKNIEELSNLVLALRKLRGVSKTQTTISLYNL